MNFDHDFDYKELPPNLKKAYRQFNRVFEALEKDGIENAGQLKNLHSLINKMWGLFAITKQRLSTERGMGYKEGTKDGYKSGFEDGLAAGYEEGKIFSTQVPDGVSFVKRKVKR